LGELNVVIQCSLSTYLLVTITLICCIPSLSALEPELNLLATGTRCGSDRSRCLFSSFFVVVPVIFCERLKTRERWREVFDYCYLVPYKIFRARSCVSRVTSRCDPFEARKTGIPERCHLRSLRWGPSQWHFIVFLASYGSRFY